MTLDILCKVVDNYGDIGVAFRLARALSSLVPAPSIRLIVDKLEAFSALEPVIDPSLGIQTVRGWTVLAWDQLKVSSESDETTSLVDYMAIYSKDPPRVIVECFACGRPAWLEDMLFSSGDPSSKTIINLEYLSAEDYAEEFHKMPSLTRSRAVRKHMFMPGFTPGTGGLIFDEPFISLRNDYKGKAVSGVDKSLSARIRLLEGLCDPAQRATKPLDELAKRFWIPVFAYERNYDRIVADIADFSHKRPVLVLVAAGKSESCFMAAWEKGGQVFPVIRLPFLRQESWDELLLASDFLIVRGEDSLSRAALSGRPFLWHAYPQAEAHQLVKVKALLSRLKPYFEPKAFVLIESSFLAFNDRLHDGAEISGTERILPFLEASDWLAPCFMAFSEMLIENGDLASGLMTFIGDIV